MNPSSTTFEVPTDERTTGLKRIHHSKECLHGSADRDRWSPPTTSWSRRVLLEQTQVDYTFGVCDTTTWSDTFNGQSMERLYHQDVSRTHTTLTSTEKHCDRQLGWKLQFRTTLRLYSPKSVYLETLFDRNIGGKIIGGQFFTSWLGHMC